MASDEVKDARINSRAAISTVVTLSIVIPTYGRPDALRRLLASLDRQLVAPFEIVVIDQNPPGTITLPPSVVHARLREPNAAAARNAGFQLTRGTHVLFVDDDEVLEPAFVSRVVATFTVHPDVGCLWPIVHGPGRQNSARRHWKRLATGPAIRGTSLFQVRRTGSGGVAFERALFRSSGGYDPMLFRYGGGSEDWELSARMRLRGLAMWCDASLFLLHTADTVGGCAIRSLPYLEARRRAVRACLFRHRIANGPPFRLRLRDVWPIVRFGFLSSLGRADARREVLRRPLPHLGIVWSERAACRSLLEAHASRYADLVTIDHLADEVAPALSL